MPIDPVLLLLEELTIKKYFFADRKNTTGGNARAPRKEMRSSIRKIIMHFRKYPAEVERISAIGAGTLTLLAAECLPSDHAHSDCLEGIGHRLSAGKRLLPDLIRLRELLHDFSHEMHIELASEISSLLKLSMKGASTPLLIFRSVDGSAARTSRSTRCRYCGFEHSG
jgi:hypothetical protein